MRLAQLIALAALASVGAGCNNYPKLRYDQTQQRIVPLQWSKAVEPLGQQQAARPLRYDALYVADPVSLPEGHSGWYRFWPNGRVLIKATFPDQPSLAANAADGDDFSHSVAGFYSVVGDRITIEHIGTDADPPVPFIRNRYFRRMGQIAEDGSVALWETSGPFGLGPKWNDGAFRPKPVENMTRKPDW